MPDSIHKTQRLLDLVALLVSRHYPLSRAQIWDEVEGYRTRVEEGSDNESLRRTFERDKKELLQLGFPLETKTDPLADPAEQQRYRLSHRDFYLPYLRLVREGRELEGERRPWTAPVADLDPEHSYLVASALHDLRGADEAMPSLAVESAFRKLTFDLARPDDVFGPPEVVLAADDEAALARVDALSAAVRRRNRVRFDYHSLTRDAHERRHVEPWGLLFKYNRWYLIAHDLDREARRTFRVSRMDALEVDDQAEAYELPKVDLGEWTGAEAWSLPGDEGREVTVDVRFSFPRSLWAARNGRGELVDEGEGGAAVRRFRVRSTDPFLRWLLSFGRDVEIEAPEALAERLSDLRRRVAEMHQGPPPEPTGPGGAAGGRR